MTMVNGTLLGGGDSRRVEMRAALVDVTGAPAVGYVPSLEGELVRPVPITPDQGGDWSADLTPNSLIESTSGDTLWAVQEGRTLSGVPIITHILVPEAGQWWVGQLRVDLADTQTGQGSIVYVPGEAGPQGAQGPAGPAGTDGQDGTPGAPGADGEDGASAYEVAVTSGFTGTQTQWLASLVGPQGEPGEQGEQGPPGADGSNADAEAYTDTAMTAEVARADAAYEPAGTATAAVFAHTSATDPHGDRAWADNKFATLTALGTLNATVTDLGGAVTNLDGFVQDCLTRVAGIEQGTAWLSALNVAGNAQISGGDLTVYDTSKGYRLRRGGADLDLEGTGADLVTSVWSGTAFNGTQHSYDRYSASSLNVQHAGKREFVDGLYGAARHVLDPDSDRIGFFGADPAGQQQVTGASQGETVASLTEALAAYGLVVNVAAPAAKGVYVPNGWGEHWRAARDTASATPARIVTLGGSATQGMYASNPITHSWPGLVRTALQAQYGDGGSGYHTTSLSSTVLASGDAAALAAWTTAGAIVGQSGTWSLSANRYGPGITGVYTDVTGSTMTFTVRGTTVKIYTISGGTRPPFTYAIDGGTAETVTVPGGTAAVQVTTITDLTPGTHTVVLTCGTTTTGQYLTVAGAAGENASGVIVDNLARAGAGSGSYATLPESALNATWNGGINYPASLAIYTAGPNDASSDVAPDVWVDNVAAWLRGVRDLGTSQGATDIILGMPHLGRHTTANYRYAEYAARLRSLAASYNAAVVDWWEMGRNSWPYWSTLGYWGTNAGTGGAGTDSVHLSNAGFAAMASPVIDLLKA
ncbi:hypothetical protein [Streptomyces sp. NBRC 110035]|uniref:hypothetical protein n=1 Tax=Streptomyces sp. NBRC 110035 TaxID=1547867 RepID=UPI00069689CB|nr:hypothetical protein [Streptomyces sp. NBRC 110035]